MPNPSPEELRSLFPLVLVILVNMVAAYEFLLPRKKFLWVLSFTFVKEENRVCGIIYFAVNGMHIKFLKDSVA